MGSKSCTHSTDSGTCTSSFFVSSSSLFLRSSSLPFPFLPGPRAAAGPTTELPARCRPQCGHTPVARSPQREVTEASPEAGASVPMSQTASRALPPPASAAPHSSPSCAAVRTCRCHARWRRSLLRSAAPLLHSPSMADC